MLKLPTATVQEPYAWVWKADDAIDKERDDWESEFDAALESNDMSRLPLKPDSKPTVFILRHTTPKMKRYFQGFHGRDDGWPLAMRQIVALSLVRIDNAVGLDRLKFDGIDATGRPCVPDETMDAIDKVDHGVLLNDICHHIVGVLNRPS